MLEPPIISFIIILLVNLALYPIFLSILKRYPLWISYIFLLGVFLEGIFVIFYTLINTYGGFGPGAWLFCFSLIIIPFLFFAWKNNRVRHYPEFNRSQKRVFLIGSIIILFAFSSPIIGNRVVGGYCDKKRMEFGNSLITKIMQFQSDNGEYPTRIFDLIPNYLPDKPAYNCMERIGLKQDALIAYYEIMVCEGNQSLVTQSITDGRVMWYDFKTGKWSRISYFDSDCH